MAADGVKPNPGSEEALDMGCKCPVLDNGHGRGDGPWVYNMGCSVHKWPGNETDATSLHTRHHVEWFTAGIISSEEAEQLSGNPDAPRP